eukprot:TRINITY_DN15122_c0_g1_i1.p1 TRINITY_DN15122_c0_g1~~TRINITY_DN15122_c0_g1_i1.p1  ORF type:complete len:254 (+),score=25.66 TRINITY_DN15122_c0_g1_i1:807-1568(+)
MLHHPPVPTSRWPHLSFAGKTLESAKIYDALSAIAYRPLSSEDQFVWILNIDPQYAVFWPVPDRFLCGSKGEPTEDEAVAARAFVECARRMVTEFNSLKLRVEDELEPLESLEERFGWADKHLNALCEISHRADDRFLCRFEGEEPLFAEIRRLPIKKKVDVASEEVDLADLQMVAFDREQSSAKYSKDGAIIQVQFVGREAADDLSTLLPTERFSFPARRLGADGSKYVADRSVLRKSRKRKQSDDEEKGED